MQYGNKCLQRNQKLGRFPKINRRKRSISDGERSFVVVFHITQILGYSWILTYFQYFFPNPGE
jgi:hypothetical protein